METFAGVGMDELWESLFRTTALYRKAAITVGEALGYTYSYSLDERVTIFHQTLRAVDRQTATREELAKLLAARYNA
jgi:aminoglycoside 6-adenylyltransferase